MSDFYSYKVDLSEEFSNVMVCYYAGDSFSLSLFRQEVKNFFSDSFFTKNIVLITASYNRSNVDKSLKNLGEGVQSLRESINSYKSLSLDLCFVSSTEAVDYVPAVNGFDVSGLDVALFYSKIVNSGIASISESRNLILQSSPNFHYIKPSGKHSSHFIKASNALECWPEISFIAINLLGLVVDDFDRVYIDTPGIYQLAYELVMIKCRFSGVNNFIPVCSFGSYQDVDSFDFSGAGNSLVIISASTSNELARKLNDKPGLSRSNIVSLFSEDEDKAGLKSLFCFNKYRRDSGSEYFVKIDSYKKHECDLCKYEISVPLSLSNKDFVFDAPKVDFYLPVAVDSDKSLREIVHKYKNTKAFRCLFDGLFGTKFPVPEFFVDVETLVSTEGYREKIDIFVRKYFPLCVDSIVYCDDSGAESLGNYIADKVSSIKGKVTVLSALGDLSGLSTKSGILVVAGSIESGKSLLNVSRKLREYKDLPITYVVGFSKYNDPDSYEKLKNDLVFSKTSLGNFSFYDIERLMLPLSESRAHSWSRELSFLTKLKVSEMTDEQRKYLNEREVLLKQATRPSVKGLSDSLFLLSPQGEEFKLGKNFAFWNDCDSEDGFGDQAMVYFTIASMLQRLRYVKKASGVVPLKSGYITKQLDPLTFDRFNEGIIQASILRSAKPSELDYSHDDRASRVLSSLLERMIDNPELAESEALPEFLLALCVGRLQIKADHFSDIKQLALPEDAYPFASLLLRAAKEIILHGYEAFIKSGDAHF